MWHRLGPWLQRRGIDRASCLSILHIVRGVAIGPFTALLLVRDFSPAEQGYFYTFSSLLALQVFVELGFGQVIVHFASHEWAHLALDQAQTVQGDAVARSRLASLARTSFCWYAVAGLILAVGLITAGSAFLALRPAESVVWFWPWCGLCLMSALKFMGLPLVSLLEGSHQVTAVYAYRVVEGLGAAVVLCIGIVAGWKLWAPVGAAVCSCVVTWGFLAGWYRRYFRSLRQAVGTAVVSWRRELWPLQWRFAVSWMSGYLTFSLFTPTVFYFMGPTPAGQMGMTWSVANAVSTVAASVIQTKVPRFGVLIARRDYTALDQLLYHVVGTGVGLAVLGGAATLAGLYWLHAIDHPFAARLLPLGPTAYLLAAVVVMQVMQGVALYLRSHKREPFMGLSVAAACLVAVSTIVGAWQQSMAAVTLGYLLTVAFFSFPVGLWIWYRSRRQWHTTLSPAA